MAIAGCGVVKWLGHYSSEQTILVVGDGDLSFSLALATAFDAGDKLVATSLDTYDTFSTAAQREGEKKMITLKSSDCEEFEVEESVAMESQTIRHMIEDDYADNGIPHPNVNSKILYKVIEYCYKHVHATATKPANSGAAAAAADTSTTPTALAKDLKNWDDELVKVDQATFFDLILAHLEEERRLREEAEAAWAVELQQERATRAAQEEEQRTARAAQEEVNKNLQEQLQMLRQSITAMKHTPPPPPPPQP